MFSVFEACQGRFRFYFVRSIALVNTYLFLHKSWNFKNYDYPFLNKTFILDFQSHQKGNSWLLIGYSIVLWSASRCTIYSIYYSCSRTNLRPLLTLASDQASEPPHASLTTSNTPRFTKKLSRAAGLDSWRRNPSGTTIPIVPSNFLVAYLKRGREYYWRK